MSPFLVLNPRASQGARFLFLVAWPYTYRWQKASAGFLARHPLCVMCLARGISTAAKHVDHIEPHRGDMRKFWNRANWQSLCEHCHNAVKQRMERTGIVEGCDVQGIPIDPAHPWNNEAGG